MRNPWKDWKRIYIIVGNKTFHIYHLLPPNTPNQDIRKLTAVLQSLEHRGILSKLGRIKIPKSDRNGHKIINQYIFTSQKVRQ